MGSVFKKQTTRPVPTGAEVITRRGERLARWKVKGKTRTAPLTTGKDGRDRVVTESPYYVAKYRDGQGVVRVVPTGCRDEQAARQVLAGLERKAELVRSGVMSKAEAAVGRHQGIRINEHLDAFTAFQRAKGCHPNRIGADRQRVMRVCTELGWTRLADLSAEGLARWLSHQRDSGELTPANSNEYR